MPPITVYTKSPINAAKASGITPQTAGPPTAPSGDSAAAPTPPSPSSRTPTSPASAPSQQHQPTKTQPLPGQSQPPPPQPGAVPRLPAATPFPPSAAQQSQFGAQAGPAPPAPTPAPALGGSPSMMIPGVSYPPQMAIPPPQTGYSGSHPHQRGTSTAAPTTAPGYSPPLPLAGGHQPGQPHQGWSGAGGASGGMNGSRFGGYVPPYGGTVAGEAGDDQGQQGMLGSAIKLAKAAGEKLSAAESEVWRRINEGSRN